MLLTQSYCSAPLSSMASSCQELSGLQQLFRLKAFMQKFSSIHTGFTKQDSVHE